MPNNRAPSIPIPTYEERLLTLPVRPGHPVFDDEYQTWRRLEAHHEEATTEAFRAATDILGDREALTRWADAHPEHSSSAEQAFTDPPNTNRRGTPGGEEPPPPPGHSSSEPVSSEQVAAAGHVHGSDVIATARSILSAEVPGGNWSNQASSVSLLAARIDPADYTDYQLAHPAPFRGSPLWQRWLTEALEGMGYDPSDPQAAERIGALAEQETDARLGAAVQSFDWKAWFGLRQLTIDGGRDPVPGDGDGGVGIINADKPAPKKRGRKSKAELAALAQAGAKPPEAPKRNAPKKPAAGAAAIPGNPPPGEAPPLPSPQTEQVPPPSPAENAREVAAPTDPFMATIGAHADQELASAELKRARERGDRARLLRELSMEISGLLGDVAPWQRLAVFEMVEARVAFIDAARRVENMLAGRHPDHPFLERHVEFDTDDAVLRLREAAEWLAAKVKRIQRARTEDQ